MLADRALCPDNLFRIRAQVSDWIADEGVQVVLINGGTGFNEQNRVPEAVGVLFERTVQGFGEMFRQLSFAEIKGSAMQSRALAGLANRTLICCLPGSTGACRLGWDCLVYTSRQGFDPAQESPLFLSLVVHPLTCQGSNIHPRL